MNDEARISKQYHGLGAEEPPRALDEAILAAARRESGAGPASLSVTSVRSRQRWYAPLATAAVLVLAVAVTLNVQHERPGIESPAPPPPRAAQPATQQELKLKTEEQLASVARQPAKEMGPARPKDTGQVAPAKPAPAAPAVREPQPFAADRAAAPAAAAGSAASRADDSRRAESSVTGSLAREMEERTSRDADAAARAPQLGPLLAQRKRAESAGNAERADRGETAKNAEIARSTAAQAAPQLQKQVDAPEKELERIVLLRGQGRHDEADKALAEFRKRYPDYRIPEAMRERVERR